MLGALKEPHIYIYIYIYIYIDSHTTVSQHRAILGDASLSLQAHGWTRSGVIPEDPGGDAFEPF